MTAFSMKVTTTLRDNGKVNQIVPIMQEHLGSVMNLARIKLLAFVLQALCVVQTVSLHKIASAMPTCVERDSNLRRLPDFNLRQCFFGEHLLPMNRGKPVAIVESEKTALVAAYYLPEYVWLASGGKNGCFNTDALRVLRARQVILYPDIGATEQWRQKLTQLRNIGIEASIFSYLEEVATDNERTAGLDIADYLLQIEPDQAVLQSMIRRNPILQKLIDDLQLTLVSVERYNPDTDAINKTSTPPKQ